MTVRELFDSKSVFTTGEVGTLLRCSVHMINTWFDVGRLEGYKLPGSTHRRVTKIGILKFCRANNLPLEFLLEGKERLNANDSKTNHEKV